MEVDVRPFASVLPYGTLQFQESYFDYQGPRFFSMRSTLGVYVFATCVDENDSDEPEYSTWLLLVVSEQRFQSIRSGGMSMLDAYRKADQGMIWKVDFEEDGSKSSRNVSFDEIPERFLPSGKSLLAIPTETGRKFEAEEIAREADAIQRNMFVIELFPENETRTELPLYELSAFARETQAVVDSLLAEKRGETSDKGKLPADITGEAELKAKYILAASFALVAVESAPGAPEVSQLPEVVGEFGKLLASTQDDDSFLNELDRHSRRTKSRFIEHAKSLSAAGCGLTIHSFNASGDSESSHADLTSIRSAIEAFDGLEPSTDQFVVRDGALIALNTKTWSFVVEDRRFNMEYKGKVLKDIQPKLDGMSVGKSTHVDVEIEVKFVNQFSEDEADRKYTLIGLPGADSSMLNDISEKKLDGENHGRRSDGI